MSVATKAVSVTAESGEVVTLNVPVGPIVEPSEDAMALFELYSDKSNWKLPLRPFPTFSEELAKAYAAAADFYVGGHELETVHSSRFGTLYVVSSLGYYHYVGA